MKLLAAFLILIIILISGIVYSVYAQDPLLPIYQELKIGMTREAVYAVVGDYYPGQMAKIHYEINGYEIWNWNWPPEKENPLETAFLGIEFFNDLVSDAFYKHVSPDPDKIEIKRLVKPK